ncbi:MAG TPA: iron-containing alcohol dehydrogenase, partial [Chromatiaceae bacterium]|nr:iron-containing alcohol dehydrogenase [Chromatiaceae bacterium]
MDAPAIAPDPSPGPPLSAAALAALEALINRLLALDPEGAPRLEPLAGRIIACEFKGFGNRLYFIPGEGGLQLFATYAAAPDCLLRGTPLALATLGLSRRQEDALFTGQVETVGDTALAHRFGAALAGLAIENSMLGAAHAAANPLTAGWGVIHGHAVGLTLPAVVRSGTVSTAANIDPGWIGVDAVDVIGRALHRPVVVVNDADAA